MIRILIQYGYKKEKGCGKMIRLYELRMEKKLSQRAIASILNVSQGTYNNWENSRTQPSIEQLIALSSLFNVSIDYIVGNSDECGIVTVEKSANLEDISLLNSFKKLSETEKFHLAKFLEKVTE